MLFIQIVECEVNHCLFETWIFLCHVDRIWIPNEIHYFTRIFLFIEILSRISKTKRNSNTEFLWVWNFLLFKWLNKVMWSHVEKHFLSFWISWLDHKMRCRLNRSSAFFIYDRISIFINSWRWNWLTIFFWVFKHVLIQSKQFFLTQICIGIILQMFRKLLLLRLKNKRVW